MATKISIIVPVPDEICAAIGEMTAHFSYLEYHAHLAVAHLLSLNDDDCRPITRDMDLMSRMTLLKRLATVKQKPPEDMDLLKSINTALDAGLIIQKRNHMIHGLWGAKGDMLFATAFRGALSKKPAEPITLGYIKETTEQIDRQTIGLQDLLSRWGGWPAP